RSRSRARQRLAAGPSAPRAYPLACWWRASSPRGESPPPRPRRGTRRRTASGGRGRRSLPRARACRLWEQPVRPADIAVFVHGRVLAGDQPDAFRLQLRLNLYLIQVAVGVQVSAPTL